MNPISTQVHGFLDYATAAMFLAVPRLFGWKDRPTRLLTAFGLFELAVTLCSESTSPLEESEHWA